MTQDKATPRPWTKEEDKVSKALWIQAGINGDVCDLYNRIDGKCIRYENAEANADLIVKAVNSHEALCKAVRMLMRITIPTGECAVDDALEAGIDALKQAGEL